MDIIIYQNIKGQKCEYMCMNVLMMSRCKQHKITSSQNSRSRKQDQEKDKTIYFCFC